MYEVMYLLARTGSSGTEAEASLTGRSSSLSTQPWTLLSTSVTRQKYKSAQVQNGLMPLSQQSTRKLQRSWQVPFPARMAMLFPLFDDGDVRLRFTDGGNHDYVLHSRALALYSPSFKASLSARWNTNKQPFPWDIRARMPGAEN